MKSVKPEDRIGSGSWRRIKKIQHEVLIGSLRYLRRRLTEISGMAADTSTGASTLTIAHDRIELTDARNRVVATGDDDVARRFARAR